MTIIQCEASVLAKALRDVTGIVTTDKVMILNNVLIEGGDGRVRITASTMETTITRTISADVEKPGAFTVPANRFRDVASALPNGAIAKISFSDGIANLVAARSKFRFATLPASDFPKLPFDGYASTIEVGKDFLGALTAVRHAFASNQTQYWLCGAFIHKREDGFRVVGLDGLRLSLRNLGETDADFPDTIIGTQLVDLILKLASGYDKTIPIRFGDGRIHVAIGDTEIFARTVDGTYPKFDHIIPTDQPITAKVDRLSLSNALNRVQLLSDDKERTVRLNFTKDLITIENRGHGDHGVEEVPCEYSGDDLAIAFRGQQLREGLVSMDVSDVEIGMSGPLAPMVMTGQAGATVVISAMRS